jgi:hypothetical protein
MLHSTLLSAYAASEAHLNSANLVFHAWRVRRKVTGYSH